MEKRIFGILFLTAAFALSGSLAYAAPSAAEQTKAAEEKARKQLKAHEWVVYVTQEGGKGAVETDVITFTEEGKVSSKNLLAKGYGDSNYRLTVGPDGVAVWETMKVDQGKNLAFLRGELRGGEMRGSIVLRSVRGITESYYYTTSAAPAESKPEPAKKKKR